LILDKHVHPKGEKLRKPPIISIVDDDDSVRGALKSLVRSLGYDTATFASAEEYLDSEALQDTSCLIADIQMSGMNGIELHERLIRDGHPTKVIFITGFPEETLRARALESGAVGFLRKPFDDNCLIKYLDKVFEATGNP
jgi:FixJ family two-component response regulator